MNQQEIKRIVDVSESLTLFFNPANGNHSIRSSRVVPMNSVLHTFGSRQYVQRPTYLSVQISEDHHILLAPEFLQYINHSCEPTVFFDTANGQITALRDIAANEEITFFYPSTEWEMTQPFDCFCGSANCLGQIQGAAHLSRGTLATYKLGAHIQRKLAQQKTTRELLLDAVGLPLVNNWQPAIVAG